MKLEVRTMVEVCTKLKDGTKLEVGTNLEVSTKLEVGTKLEVAHLFVVAMFPYSLICKQLYLSHKDKESSSITGQTWRMTPRERKFPRSRRQMSRGLRDPTKNSSRQRDRVRISSSYISHVYQFL